MLDQDFNIPDFKPMINFKELFFKILSKWYWYVISLAICYGIAHSVNVRKKSIYRFGTQVVVSKAQNPFFSSNTSLTFNWGGVSDKVQTTMTLLKSRSHNEKVVDYLQFYVDYEKQAKYWSYDAYKKVPYTVKVDTSRAQLYGKDIVIKPISETEFELSIDLNTPNLKLFDYNKKKQSVVSVKQGVFKKKYKVNEKIELPYLSITLVPYLEVPFYAQKFTIKFSNFNSKVATYKRVSIDNDIASPAILNLVKLGPNKDRSIDYLNASVKVLSIDQLRRKNQFATNTIKFVDSMLISLKVQVGNDEDELNNFREKTNSLDLEADAAKLSAELTAVDFDKEIINKKLDYISELEKYLRLSKDFTKLPAPSIAGLEEGNIVSNTGKIVSLSVERSKYEYTLKEGAPRFAELDRDINSLKVILFENIKAYRSALDIELKSINRRVGKVQSKFSTLPKDQQQYINIERKYQLSSGMYDMFFNKRSEAGLVMAANVSDLLVIDEAKDVGQGPVGPNHKLNYISALIAGLLLPTFLIVLFFLLNNKITGPEDLSFLSKIPILGIIGKSSTPMVVFERSKSPVSESFRAMRSSLEFLYKKQKLKQDTRTILVTSSVSGEGKTFTSINIASLYAMSGKNTVLIGLDLRKPKIFDDFNLHNKVGVVNYLIKNKNLSEIIQKTHIPNLDLVTSGPIPPNPSELLISDEMEELMSELKEKYDYIVLDTPPLGLVTDALDLTKFSDANIYMTRQDYTKKGMLGLINEKYENKEIENLSLVLNHYKTKTGYGYGYGYGYGVYGNGYHEVDEDDSVLEKIKKALSRILKTK
jgi:capsular exopolysaccharide synthesis family protein